MKAKSPDRRYSKLILATCILFSASAPGFTSSAYANVEKSVLETNQQRGQTVKGIVRDADGFELPGVNVIEKGTTNGATTDIDGNFSLNVSGPNAVLQISYVGFQQQEVTVGNQTSLTIRLQEDSKVMDEVVVIGYGTQKKADVTSSVASVKAESFNKGAVLDAGQLIQGKVAGLQITLPSGDPTGSSSVMLRGNSTLMGTTDPLILVDGVPGDFSTVAPEDIEAIDVLKDGSATAIYGTRGTNGVIIITTKSGSRRDMPTTIDYNGYISISQMARKPDFMSASDLRGRWKEGYTFSGANDQDYGDNVDWLDEISRTGVTHVHNATFRGGGKNTGLLANLTYEERQGTMKQSDVDNIRGRFEFVHRMFDDKLTTTLSMLANERKSNNNYNYTDDYDTNAYSGIYRQALIQNPTQPIYNEDGTYNERPVYFYDNPVSLINERVAESRTRNVRFTGSMVYRPIESLSFKALYMRKGGNHISGMYYTKNHPTTTESGYNGYASRFTSDSRNDLLELTADWAQTFGKHRIAAVVGYNYEFNVREFFGITNKDFPTDSYTYNKIEAGMGLKQGVEGTGIRSFKTSDKSISLLGRVTYNYDDRYLFMVSLRREGSSRFGSDHKWGYFPGVSVGWRMNEEAFMKDIEWIDNLKLRGGFGVTGINIDQSYVSLSSLDYKNYFMYNSEWINTLVPVRNPNPDLRWEKKYEYNVGFDFDFFGGRLGGAIDVYQRDTKDALWEYAVPSPPYLYSSMKANVGEIRNRGLEILVNATPYTTKDFNWDTNVSFSTNTNKLVSISNELFQTANNYINEGHTGEPIQTTTHRMTVGQPIGNFYGLKSVGISEDGKWVVERLKLDESKENVIERYYGLAEDANDDDKQVLGNGVPKYYMNWNNQFRYKNLDLSVSMRGAFGFEILNFQQMYYGNPTIQYNVLNSAFDKHDVVDATTGQKTGGKAVINDSQRYVSEYVEKGNYWKIDNVTLGYTFNQIKSKYIRNLRVYASCLNLATITGYKGIDPEVKATGRTPGTDDRDKYPTIRSYTFGVNITF